MLELEFRLRGAPVRTCTVRVGTGILDRMVEELVADPPGRPFVLIADSNVAPLHAEALGSRLTAAGVETHRVVFEAGEANKTRETKTAIEDRLFDLGIDRHAAVIAVGGGVTGDLAGFVAATWHRGIPVVQVPTTLLAMADAALGGKTAVDLPGGKNLVGAFHHPTALWADVSTLRTLPETELRAGFAEVVKSGMIADAKFFSWLEDSVDLLVGLDAGALEHAIGRCLAIKGKVVVRDEREAGRRAVLNFGHTVAHAIETASGYGIPHGHAVAIGMVIEADLAVAVHGLPRAHARRLERSLAAFGLPVTWPEGLDLDRVVAATHRDKKARAGRARYALPRRIGRMPAGDDVTVELDDETLAGAVRDRAK